MTATVVMALLSVVPAFGHGDEPWLPTLSTPTISPANQFHLEWMQGGAELLKAPYFTLEYRGDNNWNPGGNFTNGKGGTAAYRADGEISRLRLEAGGPLVGRLAWEIEGSLGVWGGGWMDGLIVNWHSAFGIRHHDRPRSPMDQVDIAAGAFAARETTVVPGVVALRLKFSPLVTEHHALALRADLGGSPWGPGSLQGGGGILYGGRYRNLQWNADLGVIAGDGGPAAIAGLTAKTLRLFYDLSLTVRLGKVGALTFGHRYSDPLYESGWGYVSRGPTVEENEIIASGTATLFSPRKQFFTTLRFDFGGSTLALGVVEDLWIGEKPRNLDVTCDGPDLTVSLTWRQEIGDSRQMRHPSDY